MVECAIDVITIVGISIVFLIGVYVLYVTPIIFTLFLMKLFKILGLKD